MRFTFPQKYEDRVEVRRLILQRQSWRRPVLVAMVIMTVLLIAVPLLRSDPPSFYVVLLNALPYVFIIALWGGLVVGSLQSGMIAGLAVLVTAVGLMTWFAPDPTPKTLLLNLAPYIGMVVLWFVLVMGLPLLSARSFRKNPIYQGDITVELADNEIRMVTISQTLTGTWSSIIRVEETRDYFLFFYTKNCAYFLPKRAVPVADLPTLRAFVAAHVRVATQAPTAA